MKKLSSLLGLIALLFFGKNEQVLSQATTLFFENFNGASPAFELNTADESSTTNGINDWIINDEYLGGSASLICFSLPFPFTVPHTPDQPSGIIGFPNSAYLHLSNDDARASNILNASFVAADGACMFAENNFAKMSEDISTSGFTNVELRFWWMNAGSANNFGEVYFSTDQGNTWTKLTAPIGEYFGQSSWTQSILSNPAFDDQPYLRFGFRFVNNVTPSADDPAFSVDDVKITGVVCPANNILYVNQNAAGANNGNSWTDAFTDLQDALAAVDLCPNVMEIWVAEGTYKPTPGTDRNISFVMKNGVAIYGGFPNTGDPNFGDRDWTANMTILSGEIGNPDNEDNSYHVIFNNQNGLDNSAVLDGFTISGGYARGASDCGGGMYNASSSPTVTNCAFSGNSADLGGGMCNTGSSPTVTNCTFPGNIASLYGGGMYNTVNSSPQVTNCTFSGNLAGGGGGMYNGGSSPQVTNCTFSGNLAVGGGGIFNASSSPQVANCTFSGNTGHVGSGMYNAYSSPQLANCILWGNGSEIINEISTPTVSHSIVQGGYTGCTNCPGGNGNVDPLFVNAAGGNLHLQACSPAIDAGSDASNMTTTDLDGMARKVEAIGGGQLIDIGAYEFQTANPLSDGTRWYVDAAVAISANGTSWTCAFKTLQEGLAVADSGDEIWVATGIYKPTTDGNREASFFMKSGVAIYGGFAGTETQLSQRNWVDNVTTLSGDIGIPNNSSDNAYRIVKGTGTNATAILDGFTITESNGANEGGGLYNGDNSSPTIVNCMFKGNSAGFGGAVYNRNNCFPNFFNCAFVGNTATGFGGAIFTESASTVGITNCTFYGNTGNRFVVFSTNSGTATIKNSIIWGNMSESIGGNRTTSNSIVQDGIPNCTNCPGGNGNVDPLFTSTTDLSLQPSSPAIDAGDDSANSTTLDLAGNPRKFDAMTGGNHIDLGAYEYQSIVCVLAANCQPTLTAYVEGNGSVTIDAVELDDGSTGCGTLSFTISGQPDITFNCAQIGTPQTVTLTVADEDGSATCDTEVTVQDTELPTIACPSNMTVNKDPGQCGAAVTFTPTASDNCTVQPMISSSPPSGCLFPIGETTVTCMTMDASGNKAQCTFTLTVVNSVPLSITCPSGVTQGNDASLCAAVVAYPDPTLSDYCPGIAVLQFNYTGSIENWTVPEGVTSITIEAFGAQGGGTYPGASGGRGAYVQGDFSVTPGDQLKILVGEMGKANYGFGGGGGSFVTNINNSPLLVAGGGGGAEHNYYFPGYDAVLTTSGMNVEAALGGTNGSGGQLGDPNYSGCGWSGSGGGGLTGNGGTSGDGGGFSFVNGGAGGTDPSGNCVVGGRGGFGGGGAGGNAGGGGGGYSGGAGGANIGIFPNRGGGGGGSFNGGTNQTNMAGARTGNGYVSISYQLPLIVNQTAGYPSGSTFPLGTTTNTFVVSDGLGNTETCSFDVTVTDNEGPNPSCKTTTVQLGANGLYNLTESDVFNGGTDNCGTVNFLNMSPTSVSCGQMSTTVSVTVTVFDAIGNQATCTANVTVADNIAPIPICPTNIPDVVLNQSGLGNLPANVGDGSSTDNCSVTETSPTMNFSCADVGVKTVVLTASDGTNSSTRSCSFKVVDMQIPVAHCPASIPDVELDANGNGSLPANIGDGSSTDNCTLTETSPALNFSCADVGVKTVVLTASDGTNNSSKNCSFNVVDNVAPAAHCTAQTIQATLNANAEYTIDPNDLDDGSSDACGIQSLAVSPSVLGCQNEGPNTITLTVTDVNGNTATCTATIEVTEFLSINNLTTADETCAGMSDGSIVISAVSGGGQIRYSKDGGATFQVGNTFSPLSPGTYDIVVKVFGLPAVCEKTATVTVGAGSTPTTWFKDSDGDGYTDGSTLTACAQPTGYVANATPGDCDDNDANEFPGQTWYEDLDNDGYSDGTTQSVCLRPSGHKTAGELASLAELDCNDGNATVHPFATEICNGIDDDCDGEVDEGVSGGLTYVGNVYFTTQAAVDAFSQCYSVINGSLTISGAGITDLSNLSNLEGVTGNVTIQYTGLTNMGGLDNLTEIGGTFLVFFNSSLTNLDGLEALATVGANLSIYYNFSLSDGCAIYNLINGGVTGAMTIFLNAVGCNSVAEINASCAPSSLVANPNNSQTSVGNTIGFSNEKGPAKGGFHIFPNPAVLRVTLKFDEAIIDRVVRVSDIAGRVIFEKTTGVEGHRFELDISKWRAGVYLIQVEEGGKNTSAERLIVVDNR